MTAKNPDKFDWNFSLNHFAHRGYPLCYILCIYLLLQLKKSLSYLLRVVRLRVKPVKDKEETWPY